jgi:radical SAM superfamily enzyme YgiQ (UPF0313 family)
MYMNILLVYPEFSDTFWSFKYAIEFIEKKAANPPLGLITIAAMLPSDWNLKLVDLNVTPLTDDQIIWADYIFISAMTVQRSSTKEVIHRCHSLNRKIVAGGPLFISEPEDFPFVDHLVLNEGEITLQEFVKDILSGSARRVYSSPVYPDIHTTPIPRFDLLDLAKYDCMCVQYSRGCPFHCDFCNVTVLNGHTPRIKSAEQLIAELNTLYEIGWRRNIFIVDDNFIGNKKYLKDELLPALIEWKKDKIGTNFITEASINLADDAELMSLMAAAGFVSVFIGIETPDEEGLKSCNKSQNTRRNILENVHRMQAHGLQVMAGFIVGFDSDTTDIFQRQFDFIQESGIVTAMVGLLQAPKGTELFARLQKEGRIREDFSGDNGDGETNIIPVMDSATLKSGYASLVRSLYTPENVYARIKTLLQHFGSSAQPVPLTFSEIKAFVRILFKIGFVPDTFLQFWKLLFWVSKIYPQKFAIAMTLTVYAYHFRQMSIKHIRMEEVLPNRKSATGYKNQTIVINKGVN